MAKSQHGREMIEVNEFVYNKCSIDANVTIKGSINTLPSSHLVEQHHQYLRKFIQLPGLFKACCHHATGLHHISLFVKFPGLSKDSKYGTT
jgi:hypothetical protein